MKLDTVIQRLPGWYEAGLSVYLKSAPGIGKSDTIAHAPRLIGQKLGRKMGLVIINGPLLTPGDAVGYLMPKTTADGRVESIYSDPFWFKTEGGMRLEDYEGGIVFVDEADKTDTDVKKVIGEAALSGRLGPHRLSKGWLVWMAGNESKHRSGSTKELDHLINRRMEVDVTADMGSWINWADNNGVSPIAKAFASQNPQIVFSGEVPKEQGPWCTPRSLVRSDRYLQVLAGVDKNGQINDYPDDPESKEEVAGIIGAGAMAQMFGFIKLQQEMPRYEKIVADPAGAKLPTKPDAQMLVCYNLAHRVDKSDIAPVIKYIERLPKEFAITFAKAACKRNRDLVVTPAMQGWAKTNASLMASIAN
jgi:hypothetical protein